MSKFNIGDNVIVDNPIGSYNEKFKGMKGTVKNIYRLNGIPTIGGTGLFLLGPCLLKLEFNTIPNTYTFSINEVSLAE